MHSKTKSFRIKFALVLLFQTLHLPRIELRKSKNTTRMAISGSCYGTKIRKILCSGEKQHSKTKFLAIYTFFDSIIITKRIIFKKYNPKNMRAAYLIQLNDVYIICDYFIFFLLQLVLLNIYNTIIHVIYNTQLLIEKRTKSLSRLILYCFVMFDVN